MPGLVRSRRSGRELAIQALYLSAVAGIELSQALEEAREIASPDPLASSYAEALLAGFAEKQGEIDAAIEAHLAPGWSWSRLAEVDRAVLRMAVAELLTRPHVPPKVSISEAVILAKRFGGEESGRFVNGVLGAILPETPKADWQRDPNAEFEESAPEPEAPPEETISKGSPEWAELQRVGGWVIRKTEGQR